MLSATNSIPPYNDSFPLESGNCVFMEQVCMENVPTMNKWPSQVFLAAFLLVDGSMTCDVPFSGRLYIASKASYKRNLFLYPPPVLPVD